MIKVQKYNLYFIAVTIIKAKLKINYIHKPNHNDHYKSLAASRGLAEVVVL